MASQSFCILCTIWLFAWSRSASNRLHLFGFLQALILWSCFRHKMRLSVSFIVDINGFYPLALFWALVVTSSLLCEPWPILRHGSLRLFNDPLVSSAWSVDLRHLSPLSHMLCSVNHADPYRLEWRIVGVPLPWFDCSSGMLPMISHMKYFWGEMAFSAVISHMLCRMWLLPMISHMDLFRGGVAVSTIMRNRVELWVNHADSYHLEQRLMRPIPLEPKLLEHWQTI